MSTTQEKKLGTVAMTALVVGAIVGSGIFSLPQNMAEGAGAGAILIAWAVTFVGMLALTRIFQWLSVNRPDIGDGVYGYARSGFGDYMGFNAAWGYWMSVWIGNVGYLVVMFSALGSFQALDFFGEGSTLPALACGLAVLAVLHGFVLRGVQSAAFLNLVVTVAKIVPLGLFILCVLLAFKVETFEIDFWGSAELGSVADQVKNTMLYTVWVFLGIECATVYASRARDMATVSRATILGFLITVLLLICVSVLSLGVVPQAELAQMKNPSMAAVMARAVGPWGGVLINIGLILSVGGALLAWTLISSEMLYLAARGEHNTAPRCFGRLNAHGTPANALWLTNGLIALVLVINHFNEAGYNILIQLASSMALIPYLLCAAFGLKLALAARVRSGTLVGLTALGTVYGLWLIYAGGLSYLLLSMILYAPGIAFYAKARHERGLPVFSSHGERVCAALVVGLALAALYLVASGSFSL
ncbi:basic amino acid/polyamine antiporter [Crenobacter caeni]|uniref:Amino acid permease n=1 Tax=Crenobacter caeni TaxID=2705474 RepID=A0A6B2KN97_9NEIS|nr:basic amino acid/polyamine antiporter [Crenobacter caeni]NDV11267.1 amino acid permease [Crenobacter caeni]